VFAHIHPVGTYSMAAQRSLLAEKPSQHTSSTETWSALTPEIHRSHTNQAVSSEISFPYAFPEPGSYCMWVQMRSQGRIFTGVFEAIVAAAK
jgi:hypothetical protein